MTSDSRFLLVSTWAPPMKGGPRNLFHHLRHFPKGSFEVLTMYQNFTYGSLDTSSWLDVPYHFFDYKGEPERGKETLKLDLSLLRYKPLDKLAYYFGRLWKLLVRRFYLVLDLLGFMVWVTKVVLRGRDIKTHKRFDTIVSISDMGWCLVGGYFLSLLYRKRFVLYFFDLYADNYLLRPNKKMANFFEPRLFKKASLVLVTNEATKAFYQKKYPQAKIEVIYNSTDAALRDFKQFPSRHEKPFRIVYTGNLYWPHEQAFHNLFNALAQLKHLDIELHIYSMSLPESFKPFLNENPRIKTGSCLKEEIPAILANGNLLFLPFSWNTPSDEIIRTASPAKLTEYLASGTPILVHAPEYAYVSQLIKKQECGFVVDENDASLLAKRITEIYDSGIPDAEGLGRKAQSLVTTYFDETKNAKKLEELLTVN